MKITQHAKRLNSIISSEYFAFDSVINAIVIHFNTWVYMGAQWLSGRVLDSRPKGCGFEPHQRQYVVVLEQDTFILA